MDTKQIKGFKQYLATGEVPAEDEAIVITGTVSVDPMFEILSLLCATEMLAKDFHYRAKGKSFYGEHLFADLLWKIGDESDKLNEIYFMGELQGLPPYKSEVAKHAVSIVDGIPEMANEDGYINALYDVSNKLVAMVEQAKEKKTLSGTTAILDGISEQALQNVALLKRILAGEEFVTKVDADASSPVKVDMTPPAVEA